MAVFSIGTTDQLREVARRIEAKRISLTDSLSLETQSTEAVDIGSWRVDAG